MSAPFDPTPTPDPAETVSATEQAGTGAGATQAGSGTQYAGTVAAGKLDLGGDEAQGRGIVSDSHANSLNMKMTTAGRAGASGAAAAQRRRS